MAKFELGRVCGTQGTKEVERAHLMACLHRHATGDWGDVSEHDRRANDAAVACGERTWSVYPIDPGQAVGDDNKLYVITEADRSATTILLPDEY